MNIPKELIILIVAILLTATAAFALENAPEQRTSDTGSRSTEAPASDTLEHVVEGGEILIIDLPEELNGRAVDSYSLLRAPALSWLVDYSFMWRTLPQDSGQHDVLVRAESDTLVVSVTVE